MSELIKNILEARIGDLQLPNYVQSCSADALVHNVLIKLRETKIGCMVIVEKGKPVGLFTGQDYLMKIAGLGVNIRRARIRNFMTPKPTIASTRDTVGSVLLKLRMGQSHHILIIDGQGKLKDVLSHKDMLDLLLTAITQRYALAA